MIASTHNAPTDTRRTILLTGATGLVGAYLIDRLVRHTDWDIHALVRAKRNLPAMQRIQLLAEYFHTPEMVDRVVLHEGDVTAPDLNMNADERRWLRAHTTDLLHAAAEVSFAHRDAVHAHRTNVNGTRHVLDELAGPRTRFFHVSTAYVAGCTDTLFRENDLDVGQTFRNDYEKSKFEAEKMLRDRFAASPEQLTVFRPSIIVGERRTARTLQAHHFYSVIGMLKAFAERCPGHDFDLEFAPDAPQNGISIDAVADLIMDVLTTPRNWGATYHLVDPDPLPNRELRNVLEKALNLHIENRSPDSRSHPMNRAFIRRAAPYLPYLRHQPTFDCSAAGKLQSWQAKRYLQPRFIEMILESEYMQRRTAKHGLC
jgi:thioester reductase-like protein